MDASNVILTTGLNDCELDLHRHLIKFESMSISSWRIWKGWLNRGSSLEKQTYKNNLLNFIEVRLWKRDGCKKNKKKLKAILTKSLRVLLNKLSYYPSITHASNDGILKTRISSKMKEKGKARPDRENCRPENLTWFYIPYKPLCGIWSTWHLPPPPPPLPRPSILLKVGEHHLSKEPGAANSLAIVPMKLNEWSRIKHLNSHR